MKTFSYLEADFLILIILDGENCDIELFLLSSGGDFSPPLPEDVWHYLETIFKIIFLSFWPR